MADSTPNIQGLMIQINSNANSALNGLDRLTETLERLKGASGASRTVTSTSKAIANLATSIRSLDLGSTARIDAITKSLASLNSLPKSTLSSYITPLQKLPQSLTGLTTVDFASVSSKLAELSASFQPLQGLESAKGLSSTITQLKKLPEVATALSKIDFDTFTTNIQQVTTALSPLANTLDRVTRGVNNLPTKLNKVANSSYKTSASMAHLNINMATLAAKAVVVGTILRRVLNAINSFVLKSTEYTENLNLFTVAMGDYADEAMRYAEQVERVMGIDPSEWIRNQGIFMTLATGFGVVNDRAYIMSKNLTQLGYDLSSFFNMSFSDAILKLQSGLAGELEPLRRLGYDLSNTRLEQTALELGIDKLVSEMTQAEKAELRYYAIMTQVTEAQGDMARTLEAPANQLRILKSQFEMLTRSIGNVFIPILNKVLPYAIAFVQVLRLIADTIARIVGFTLPEFDYSGLEVSGTVAEDIEDSLGGAAGNAKKMKDYLLGIDELNVINPKSGSGGDGGNSIYTGAGFEFDLPEYDFLGNAVNERVTEIVENMKEWLGLTEDIDSWSDFFDTRLGNIIESVGVIGAGIGGWALSSKLLSGLGTITALTKGFAVGLTIAGVVSFGQGFNGLLEGNYSLENMLKTALGLGAIGAGVGFIVGGWAGAGVGLAIGLTLGIASIRLAGLISDGEMDDVFGNGVIGAFNLDSRLQELASSIADKIRDFARDLPNRISDLLRSIDSPWVTLNSWLTDRPTVSSPFSVLLGESLRNIPIIGDLVRFVDRVNDFVHRVVGGESPYQRILEWVGLVDEDTSVESAINGTSDRHWFSGIGEAISREASEISHGWDSYEEAWVSGSNFFESTINTNIQTWHYIADGIGSFFGKLNSSLDSSRTAISGKLNELSNTVSSGFNKVGGAFKSGMASIGTGDTLKLDFKVDTSTVSKMGEDIVNTFKSKVNYMEFYNVAKDTVDGYKNGIGELYKQTQENVKKWAKDVKDTFKGELDIHSPSRVFGYFANMSIQGFNESIAKGVSSSVNTVGKWAEAIGDGFVVDYSRGFAQISAMRGEFGGEVTASADYVANVERDSLEAYFDNVLMPMLVEIANDAKRQADKSDKTYVQIDGRTVATAVNKQNRADGYSFT